MCGRTTIAVTKNVLERRFEAEMEADFKPIYNAAPSQKLPIIRNNNSKEIELAKWGYLPKWLEGKRSQGFINAVSETIFDKPSFRKAIWKRRCLVPADSFFEWHTSKETKSKIPYRILLKSRKLFAMAGIWEEYSNDQLMYCVLTVRANKVVKSVHHRMPVILPIEKEKKWLEKELTQKELEEMFEPFSDNQMEIYQVSSAVNNPLNNEASIIEEI